MKYLLLYSSTDGHTQKIVEHIAAIIKKQDTSARVTVESLNDKNLSTYSYDILGYDRILVGAAIRYGHFHSNLNTFARQYRDELHQRGTAFFGVNLTARKPNKRTPETNPYIKKWLAQSPWKPNVTAVFAGALYYPRYSFFDRTMIRFIMYLTGGDTDPTTEKVYTDWAAVDAFSQTFAGLTTEDVARHQSEVEERKKKEEVARVERNSLCVTRVVTLSVLGAILYKLFLQKKSTKSSA